MVVAIPMMVGMAVVSRVGVQKEPGPFFVFVYPANKRCTGGYVLFKIWKLAFDNEGGKTSPTCDIFLSKKKCIWEFN